MARKSGKKPAWLIPHLTGTESVGNIRNYQLTARWDEMTADERAEFESLDPREREQFWEDREYRKQYDGISEDDYSEDSDAEV